MDAEKHMMLPLCQTCKRYTNEQKHAHMHLEPPFPSFFLDAVVAVFFPPVLVFVPVLLPLLLPLEVVAAPSTDTSFPATAAALVPSFLLFLDFYSPDKDANVTKRS